MAVKYRSILDNRDLGEIEGEGSGVSDEEILRTTGAEVGRTSEGEGVNEADNQKSVLKLRGAHLDVLNGLSNITFVDGMSCGMSEDIAYIRYWSRSGVSRNAEAIEQEAVDTVPTDRSGELKNTISEQYGTDFNPEPPISGLSERPVNANTPVNPFKEQQTAEDPDSNNSLKLSENLSGPLYSANPFGSTESSTSPVGSGVWQFLFNPEELPLTSGPEYNRAESWGVSDPANSGQPLSWRRNQNRKLNFGRILLHGYTFGKRVDSLEKGLQDLFMAREGDGDDGPPVLEFVWGRRVFGPCVIQNVQVREKAWDKGILVNAEVSFDLEQVPEWTINDGFVDVLRPGRQPTVNDPYITSENYRDVSDSPPSTEEENSPEEGETPPATRPGGGGGSQISDAKQCEKAQNLSKTLQKDFNESGRVIFRSQTVFVNGEELEKEYKSIRINYIRRINTINNDRSRYDVYKTVGNKIESSGSNYNCSHDRVSNTLDDIVGNSPDFFDYRRGVQFINGCQKAVKGYTDEWILSEGKIGGKCVSLKKARIEAEKTADQEERDKNCKKTYANRKSCIKLGTRETCNGVSYNCRRNPSDNDKQVWIVES